MGVRVTPLGEASCLLTPPFTPASSGRGHQHSLRTSSQPWCLAVALVCTQEMPVASPLGQGQPKLSLDTTRCPPPRRPNLGPDPLLFMAGLWMVALWLVTV